MDPMSIATGGGGITGGASGEAKSGNSNGNFSFGGQTINKTNPWMIAALIAIVLIMAVVLIRA